VIILIVDDDPSRQAVLRSWLEGSGHEVSTVPSRRFSSNVLQETGADIVLCDWHSEGLRGEDACKIVRGEPIYRYLLVYSGMDQPLDFETCAGAGADDILIPPMRRAQLQVRILSAERMLNLQRAFAEQNAEHVALNQKLDDAYQALYAELQAASELQLSLLPTISEVHPGYNCDWLVLPSSFLAGDNLNYFIMQERYLIFYHLDVAGHGIPSALLSVTLNQLLSPQPGSPMVRFDPQLELKRIVPPVDVVSELNRRFQPQGDGYFTMIYAVLDTQTHEVRFCQAGHPSPIKFAADGTVTEVGEGGFPVGLWPEMTYDETVTSLLPGERIVLYSDGITACLNEDEEPYSLERFKELISMHSDKSLKEVLQEVQTDLEKWVRGRDFPDDISLLMIESKIDADKKGSV
jgi:sigma-B regulation protein RsbU (phosphoserine phosphatase)